MTKQEELVGPHPSVPNQFARWLSHVDHLPTSTKCHRALEEIVPCTDSILVDWFSRKLIHHHYTDDRIAKLKAKYADLGFSKYAEQHRKLPRADKTKKGNGTEALLIEYIEGCQAKNFFKAFKLRYNPNVDQSIKGDDTLLVDIYNDGSKDRVRLFLGESKFRATPTKAAIDDITNSLKETKNPLSYSFLVDQLSREASSQPVAELMDTYLIEEIKGRGDLIYVGFLLSSKESSTIVESSLSSNNARLLFISVGIDNPETLINQSFDSAELLLSKPATI